MLKGLAGPGLAGMGRPAGRGRVSAWVLNVGRSIWFDRPAMQKRFGVAVRNGVEPASGESADFGFRFELCDGSWGQVNVHHWASLRWSAGAAFGFGGIKSESDDTVNGAYPLNQEGVWWFWGLP